MKDRASDSDSSATDEQKPLQEDLKLDIEAGLPGDPPLLFGRKQTGWLGRQSPFFQKALVNLTLILIWWGPQGAVIGTDSAVHPADLARFHRYFFSTLLSVWNSILLGRNRGVFHKGAFPGMRQLDAGFHARCC